MAKAGSPDRAPGRRDRLSAGAAGRSSTVTGRCRSVTGSSVN